MIDGFLRLFHVGFAFNKSFIFPQFFAEERTRKNEHGSTFLEAMKVHMTRIKSFYKLKMLRHAQIQIVASQTSQKTADTFFYRRERFTKALFNKNVFFQKMGVGPEGPRKRKALAPIFWEKHFVEKNICVPFAFVKNGTGAF